MFKSNNINQTMKNKNISIIIICLSLLIVGSSFYWFQVRPSQIRRDCSWTKKHSDAVVGVTQEEADRRKAECIERQNKNKESGMLSDAWYELNVKGCEDTYKSSTSQPAKDWYEKASEKEYDFCLHSKGLK